MKKIFEILKRSPSPVITITAGGTGGHILPALMLSQTLLERSIDTVFITDKKGWEFIECHHYEKWMKHCLCLPVRNIRHGNIALRFCSLIFLGISFLQCLWHCLGKRPCLVIGFGGYVTFPILLASFCSFTSYALHEQNSILGLGNRLFARRAKFIATTFEKTLRLPKGVYIKQTGLPVRQEFIEKRLEHERENDEKISLFILGGSQGARVFGDLLPAVAKSLDISMQKNLKLSMQCRPEQVEEVRLLWKETLIDAKVSTYFDDVDSQLQSCHLFIGRAGASTLAEVSCLGKPSILIPYPHAADDHQRLNAKSFEEKGAAIMVLEDDQLFARFTAVLMSLLESKEKRCQMARYCRDLGKPEALIHLVDMCVKFLK